MSRRIQMLATATVAFLVCTTAWSQEVVSEPDPETAVADIRQSVQAARRQIIQEEMFLSEAEAAVFWPMYEAYRREINSTGDRYAALITDFAKKYNDGSVSADDAQVYVDERIEIEAAYLATTKKYVGKLRQVLPTLKVTRFYQLESKMNAEANAQMALAIRLIDLE